MAADASILSVSLLLDANGANNATATTDKSPTPKTVSFFGNAKVSTAQSKFGGTSFLFDGSGDYLTVPASTAFAFGTGDFTVELWFRPSALNIFQALFFSGPYNSSQLALRISDTNKVQTFFGDGTGAAATYGIKTGATSLSVNTWHHIAVSCNSGTVYVYLDGVLQTSGSTGSYNFASTTAVYIGSQHISGTPGLSPNGHIDEVRVTKGVGRYPAGTTFTPPSTAFADFMSRLLGNVVDADGNPAQRTVRAYRRDTGALISSAQSDATTGDYEIKLLVGADVECNVICLDDDVGTLENDLIHRAYPVTT